MAIQALIVGIVLALVVTLIRRRAHEVVIIGIAGTAAAWAFDANLSPANRETQVENRPVKSSADNYISSETCRACHPQQYSTWHASYHRTMTQIATPSSVVGSFDDVDLELWGRNYHLTQREDKFFVDITYAPAPDGTRRQIERPIVMTTGSHHMQAYWYATGDTRLVRLIPFVYLFADKRWVPRRSVFMRAPSRQDVGSETSPWNRVCIQCHATHGQPRMVTETQMDTQVAEFGIACEACHGPAEEHARANRNPVRRYSHLLSETPDRTITHPARLSARHSSQVCGQCHGIHLFHTEKDGEIWLQCGFPYRPGDELADSKHTIRRGRGHDTPAMQKLMREKPWYLDQKFWSDGMVRVSGREYNGLIESPCHERGELSCLSCHSMHMKPNDPRPTAAWTDDQLKIGADGNSACTQCHDEYVDEASLANHTHHAPHSSGSECYNCHMPHTTYGLLKAIRSHEIDSPTVQASLETGRPNACNLCHLDQTLDWTASHLHKWYGTSIPQLSDDEQSIPASLLWLIRGDAGQRVLIGWHMGWEAARSTSGQDWMAPFLSLLLDDSYDVVRYVGARSLKRLPGFEEFEYDYLCSPEESAAAKERASNQWFRSSAGSALHSGGSIFIGADHRVNFDVVSQLLSQRDERPVNLAE